MRGTIEGIRRMGSSKRSGVKRVQVGFSSTFQCIEKVQRQCAECDTLILRRRSSYSMNRVFQEGHIGDSS